MIFLPNFLWMNGRQCSDCDITWLRHLSEWMTFVIHWNFFRIWYLNTNFWMNSVHLRVDLLLTGFWRQEFLLEFYFQISWANQWDLFLTLNVFKFLCKIYSGKFLIKKWSEFHLDFDSRTCLCEGGRLSCHWVTKYGDANPATQPSMGDTSDQPSGPLSTN